MSESIREFRDTFAAAVIRSIARNARKILVFCLLAAVGASVYTLAAKKLWASWAVLMVPGQQSSMGLGGILGMDLSGFGGGMLDDLMGQSSGTDITIAQQVLGSRLVMERLIIKYDLIQRLNAPNMERTLERFVKRVSITLTPESLLLVSVKGESRQESAAMVQDMINFANQELSRIVTSRARRARIEAERSFAVAADSLYRANARLERFRSESGLLIPEQGGILISMLSEMQRELVLAGSELTSISAGVSSRSSSWARASARYEYLREAVHERITGEGDGLTVFPPMDSLPSMIRQYEELFLEVETRRMVFMLLRHELETLRLEEAKESPTLEVLVPPTPAHERVFPRRTVLVIMITFLSFVLAVAWIITLEWYKALMESGNGSFWRETWGTMMAQLRPGSPNPARRKRERLPETGD
jgi:uncharacterized protein involved in exopolysaccharide biosynthesis